jgi:TatD DNase family protein
MQLIDTHCHLDVGDFDADRGQIVSRCRERGLGAIVVPAIHARGWSRLLTVCAAEPLLFPALGLHPVYQAEHRPEHLDDLSQRLARERPVAIGEIGLDFFIPDPDVAGQQACFEAQLGIAEAAGLPVLLHVRKAHDQVLATLRRRRFSQGGIAHAFNGSLQQARQYIDLGFRLGFGGVMTLERARNIRRLAVELPLDAIVLETDAPDLPPAAHYGERNSPEYLPEMLAELAALRGESPAVVAAATTANARAAIPGLADGAP